MSTITNILPSPEIYYEHNAKTYWLQDQRRRWIKLNESSVHRYLQAHGYGGKKGEGDLSPADDCLMNLQLDQNVDFANGLAGYQAGFRELNGSRVLITESPRPIVPQVGEWPLLNQVLDGLLNDPVCDQRPYFYGWCKHALEGLRDQRWSQAQALALAGPVGSGKSLVQDIITELFGGRYADAYNFMIGRTDFNVEMFRAEHLMIEDKAESTSFPVRRQLAAHIKQVAANQWQYCHGKNRDAVRLNPLWRITISLNDDPERIMILPPLDRDIAEKVILLRANQRPMPMPASTGAEKELFRAALSAELPAFVEFLQTWAIPEELRDPRYGIIAYHHPELLLSLDETAPELRFLSLIDEGVFGSERLALNHRPLPAWTGTAVQLEGRLKLNSSSVVKEVERMLYFGSACGSYLGRLVTKRPQRVSKRVVHGQSQWTIQPPARDENESESRCGEDQDGSNPPGISLAE